LSVMDLSCWCLGRGGGGTDDGKENRRCRKK